MEKNIILALLLLDISCAASSAAGSSGDLSHALEQPVEQEQVELRCFKPQDVPRYFNDKIVQVQASAISKKPIAVKRINNLNGNEIFFTIVGNDYSMPSKIKDGDKTLTLILPIDSIDSPTLCIEKKKDETYDYCFVQLNKNSNSDNLTGFLIKSHFFQYDDRNRSTKELTLEEAHFYLKLLEKGFVLAENIIHSNCVNIKFYFPDFVNLANFCRKSIERLKFHIRNNPDEFLPLIEKYIDKIPDLFPYIEKFEAIKILEKNPGLIIKDLETLNKFFANSKFRYKTYSILRKAALDFKNNPDNLQTIAEDAIAKLERIRIIQLF